jgi:cytochrome c oxidase subunit 1
VHGNWGPKLPAVYRWAYDYSVPGAEEDFLPQTLEPVMATAGNGHEGQRAKGGKA